MESGDLLVKELRESIPAKTVGGLTLCASAYTATFDGRPLDLSGTEVEMLHFLLENESRVSSRQELAILLGKRESTIDILITRLRQKVGRDFIRNVRGRGWIVDRAKLEV